MLQIKIKRVYESPSPDDGLRILVDRLWPRGLRKQQAQIDLWMREVAPSDVLRKWFGHNPEKWGEFQRRYFAELDQKSEQVRMLLEQAAHKRITLLYAARDEQFNNARALKKYLEMRCREEVCNRKTDQPDLAGARS